MSIESISDCSLGEVFCAFEDKDRDRPLDTLVWYPTLTSKTQEKPGVWEHPRVALDSPVTPGKHPLILVSHGWKGENIELVWFAEKLTKQGYIVAAVNHHGNTWQTFSEELSNQIEQRPQDISKTLDYLLTDSPFACHIEKEKIGFAGFSIGGLTGLWLAGGEINNASYEDKRFRTFFLMAPRGADFSETSLGEISSPMYIVTGETDQILPIENHAAYIHKHAPNSTLNILEGEIGHFVFLNCPTKAGLELLAPAIVQDASSVNRADEHSKISKMAIDFFSKGFP